MATITLQGNAITTIGELPVIGSQAIDFQLIKNDLSKTFLKDYKGKRLVLNIFPSIDTGTCATSVRTFNKAAADLENTVVLCISRDLPFAQARFCDVEGIENIITVSDFVQGAFGKNYGLTINVGPMADLHSRAVVILDKNHKVIYTEQVAEIVDEPNYKVALDALK